MPGLELGIRIALAAVFAVAGTAKLADRDGSRRALRDFGVPARLAGAAGVGLPLLELSVAIGLLISASAWFALAAAAGLLLGFIAAIGVSMARGAAPDCHCFGQLHSEPAGWSALARNCVLFAAAAVALTTGQEASQLSPVAWVGQLTPTGVAVAALTVVVLSFIAAEGWLLFELLRQHGRILARLDALEARAAGPGAPAGTDAERPAIAIAMAASNRDGHKPGLAVGALAPEFDLSALDGARVSLSMLRARRAPVVLIFTDPACGPCNALLPDIGDWQRRYARRLTIALVSRAGAETNRAKAQEHGLENVLLQGDREVSALYEAHGTPSAVVVSADGRIASSLSTGAAAITALVETWAGGGSKVVRPSANGAANGHHSAPVTSAGLAIGSQAPDVTLEDLDGRPVSLHERRGEALVVLFWNPRCGFCQRILPDLRAWQDEGPPGAPALLVVSTGEVETNRAMGLRSPVVLDQTFQTARSFGASGTPSAIRIDPTGRIATPLAIGAPGVLALLGAKELAQPGKHVAPEVV